MDSEPNWMVGHRTTLSHQASCKCKCHAQKNSEPRMLSFLQTITERVHIEKRYGPRRQSTSLDDDSDIQVQIRGKNTIIMIFSAKIHVLQIC